MTIWGTDPYEEPSECSRSREKLNEILDEERETSERGKRRCSNRKKSVMRSERQQKKKRRKREENKKDRESGRIERKRKS
jgi:hypothetical protein